MAGLSDLTPDQMLVLQQLGMLRGLSGATANTASGGDAIGAQASNYSLGPNAPYMQTGNVGGSLPFDGGNIRGGINYQSLGLPDGRSTSVIPNVGVNVGPVSGNYSAAITPQGTQQSVGGGFDFGPFALNYQRGLGNERVKPTDTFGVSAPIGPALLNAAMTRGEGIPTQYSGGVTVPGLLGGDFGLTASYSPEDKKKAVFGRFSKRF